MPLRTNGRSASARGAAPAGEGRGGQFHDGDAGRRRRLARHAHGWRSAAPPRAQSDSDSRRRARGHARQPRPECDRPAARRRHIRRTHSALRVSCGGGAPPLPGGAPPRRGGGPGPPGAGGSVPPRLYPRDGWLLDQRGTGKSNPLRCEFRGDPNDMRGYFGEAITLEAVRACRTELEKVAALRLYTTTIAMADLDEVRAALGYERVNVYGGSYGSTAALAYLQLYPQHVRTATLSSVAPLDYKLPLPFGKAIDRALERLFADCAADATCRGAFPDLRKEFAAVVERLDKGPVTFDTLNPVTGQKQQVTMTRIGFAENVRVMLYHPNVMNLMPLLIHQMYQQDYAYFGLVAYQVSRATLSALASGMQLSVVCAEDIPYINESEIAPALAGTFYGEARVRLYQKVCEQWPRGDVPAQLLAPARSDVPVLILSGDIDPVTPPEAATPLLRGLPNAPQSVLRNATHNPEH